MGNPLGDARYINFTVSGRMPRIRKIIEAIVTLINSQWVGCLADSLGYYNNLSFLL